MSDDRSRYRPWETEETQLTDDQVKEQAARLLAYGALQSARKRSTKRQESGRHIEEVDER